MVTQIDPPTPAASPDCGSGDVNVSRDSDRTCAGCGTNLLPAVRALLAGGAQ